MKPERFFGRQYYIEILEKRIKGLKDGYRQNIALLGDELVGKTSLIFKLLQRVYDNHIIMLYLESRPESLESFCRRFIGVLLYNFLSNSNIPLKEDLGFLLAKSEKYIPKTADRIRLILAALKKRKKNGLFTELLSLCESIHQESNKFCVVIFDEFQNLEHMDARNLYREWSKLLISQKHTMYIIASSARFKAKNILSNNLSLLFGNFEVLTVEPFDIQTSEEYLKFNLKGQGVSKGLTDFIIHFTGGHPFYLQLITDVLLKSPGLSLTDILEEMFFSPSGVLNQRFSNYLKRFQDNLHRQDYLSILYLVSGGSNKINDIAHLLRKQKKELLPRINYLIEIDVISRSADFLAICDRVFSFWLKFVYQGKAESLTFDAKNQSLLFRDKINNMIEEFMRSVSSPIAERFTELLRQFSDDMIRIEKRKVRLDHLREIKPLEFKGRNLNHGIIGRSHDTLWIICFKNDLLTEDDVAEFARECKKYRHKLQKKVIIALHDVDSNARLRALEEKILTWDLNNLNQLFDAFSKPRVIV